MSGHPPSGHLLGLNGGSSAGKTTIGRRLQSELGGSWLLVGIDLLIWALPVEMVGDPSGIEIVDGQIRRGSDFSQLYAAFRKAVTTLVSSGVDVILDDVLLEGMEDQRRWDEELGDLPVYWVAVHCDADTAAVREEHRGDRPSGIARAQAASVHRGVRYDIELDTGIMDLADSVTVIQAAVRRCWPISSMRREEAGPGLPATSAWTSGSSRRPAPWER